MKKVYFNIAVFALFVNSAIAQVPTTQNKLFTTSEVVASVSKAQNQNKALGFSVWSNDFTTPSDWVVNNAGEPAPFGWTIDAVNDSWFFSTGITSTSGGNYAEMYNGDPSTGSPAPTNSTFTMTTATSIDIQTLAGTSNVLLQFEQYGALFQDMQEVQVSVDGINFVTVGNNANDIDPLTQSGGSAYPNPMLRSFNIASAISGNPSTVWIRFSWSPGAQNIAYGWYIDDVAIVTLPDNDLKVGANDWGSAGLHYYQIPLVQAAPIDFWSIVSNEGLTTQTNSQINVDVNTGTFTGSSAAVSIATGMSDSLAISGLFTPSANGTYTFTWNTSSDFIDDVPANNVLNGDSFIVNTNIYARDSDGTPVPGGGADGADPTSFAFEAGSLFNIFADDTAKGIDIVVGPGTLAGTIIYGKIYELDNTGNFVYVDETAEYTTTAADATSSTPVTLVLFASPTLITGKTYFVAVGCYSELYYGVSGFSPDQTSFIFYGGPGGAGSQYFTNGTPMVRLNFDPSLFLCSPNTSTQSATSCGAYTWSVNNQTYSSSGAYTSVFTNVSGCDSVVTLNLTINQIDTTVVSVGVTLSATTNNSTYQWLDCNNGYSPINGETNQSYTATSVGDYAVLITSNGCTDTSSCYFVTDLSVSEIDDLNEVIVYPNPSKDMITVSSDNKIEIINLYGIRGRLIRQIMPVSSEIISISLPKEKGIYILECRTSTGIVVKRVVRE